MNISAHPDAELSGDQLENLLQRLLDNRQELTSKLEILNAQISAREDCSLADAAEAASLREQAMRASGIAAQHNQTIAEIDAALRRLETGRYGVSRLSGEPIPLDRLRLIPWATTCPDE